jgi:hypothetical protein
MQVQFDEPAKLSHEAQPTSAALRTEARNLELQKIAFEDTKSKSES